MPTGTVFKFVMAALFVMVSSGCATTYVPISWDHREQVLQLSRTDRALSILFQRYDPQRQTLRLSGESFDEVMWPSEVQYRLGAYRKETKLIYSNLYKSYTDAELRSLLLHEFAHHIWFQHMLPKQRDEWVAHLERNPSPLQDMVRAVYHDPRDYDAEDFAFSMQNLRPIDILELAKLKVIGGAETEVLLAASRPVARLAIQPGTERANLRPALPTQPQLLQAPTKGNHATP